MSLGSFSFVDKTGSAVTIDVKSNDVKRAAWNMEGSYWAHKMKRQKQWLRSEQFELPIVYGVGLPFK